ncbi:MAG: 5-formyltetrahydrofolate cyclo-ligase [Oscillospiraceae bacterium]
MNSYESEKGLLRKKVNEILARLTEDDIISGNDIIFNNTMSLPEYAAARTVFAYHSMGREPDTRKILDSALSSGKTVALPLITGAGIMEARIIKTVSELVPGKFGIPSPPEASETLEPRDIDFILVPAVAFDVNGYRLGRGGGFYDRFLAKTTAYAAGLSREAALLSSVPREVHDLPVQCIITEKRIARL